MIEDRRMVERRAMPHEVKRLVEELRAISRAPGARTPDGVEWRTIRKGTVDLIVDLLLRSSRGDDAVRRS